MAEDKSDKKTRNIKALGLLWACIGMATGYSKPLRPYAIPYFVITALVLLCVFAFAKRTHS